MRAQGIVTNATDVKPMVRVATYLHDASGCEVYQEVTGKPTTCAHLEIVSLEVHAARWSVWRTGALA